MQLSQQQGSSSMLEHSHSRGQHKRIFGNPNHNSHPNPTNLHFSQIDSFEQHHIQPPSQSMIQLFSSRMAETKTQIELNFAVSDSLHLPPYKYEQLPSNSINLQGAIENNQKNSYMGVFYRGMWKNDKPHGKGKMLSRYEQYEGWFNNGVKHNSGREIRTNEVYEGEFVQGRRKGDGVLYTKQGVQRGEFDETLVRGRVESKDGSIFEGELDHKGRKTGRGVFILPDGSKYDGFFLNDSMSGEGEMLYSDGSKYKGQFMNGVRNGWGMFQYAQNVDQRYEGEYVKNVKEGRGKLWLSLQKGHFYEGGFKMGEPHGKGILLNHFGEREVQFHFGVLSLC